MQKRRLLFGEDARKALEAGVCKAADAIRVTMGARGRLVSLFHGPLTKDGVSVARNIELEDPFEDKGAKLVRSASMKTCDDVGDGTTLTAVLTRGFVTKGFEMIRQGKDAQELKKEIEATKPEILKAIEKATVKVKDAKQAASISANDEEIGKVVAEAVNAVGHDGLVTVENAYVPKDTVEIVKGCQIDQGAKHPVFFTDTGRRRAEYKDAHVLLYSGNIHDIVGLGTLLDGILPSGKAVVIVAHGYDDTVMHNLMFNRAQRGLKILPVTAPHVYREEVMQDLAEYTGAVVLTENDALDKVFWAEVAGKVAAVASFTDRTIFQPHKDQEEAITKRIEYIMDYAKQFKEDERREVEKRAARLAGRIAVIRTNSATEDEQKEKRDRYEDAIYAAQSALRDGVVTGGGYTWVKIAQKMKKDTEGAELVSKVLLEPAAQIARNAGRNPTEVLNLAKKGLGYNARTDSFEDLAKAGIVDPAAVLRHALENAMSVSCLVLTTEVLIANVEVKE